MTVTTIERDGNKKFIVELSYSEASLVASHILAIEREDGVRIARMFTILPIDIISDAIRVLEKQYETQPLKNLAIRLFQAQKLSQQTKEQ